MRLNVIEQMFRKQYCLRDEDTVDVRHTFTQDNKSEYEITDIRTVEGVTTEQKTFLTIKVRQKDPVILDIENDCRCPRCHKTFYSKMVAKTATPKNMKILNAGTSRKLPTCPHCKDIFFFGLPFIKN